MASCMYLTLSWGYWPLPPPSCGLSRRILQTSLYGSWIPSRQTSCGKLPWCNGSFQVYHQTGCTLGHGTHRIIDQIKKLESHCLCGSFKTYSQILRHCSHRKVGVYIPFFWIWAGLHGLLIEDSGSDAAWLPGLSQKRPWAWFFLDTCFEGSQVPCENLAMLEGL